MEQFSKDELSAKSYDDDVQLEVENQLQNQFDFQNVVLDVPEKQMLTFTKHIWKLKTKRSNVTMNWVTVEAEGVGKFNGIVTEGQEMHQNGEDLNQNLNSLCLLWMGNWISFI